MMVPPIPFARSPKPTLGVEWEIALVDPETRDLAPKALAAAREGGWLAPGALIVIEEAASVEVVLGDGFEALERREYGETALGFWRHTPA